MIIVNGSVIDNTIISSGRVAAINKTGATINRNDKVWVAPQSLISGNDYVPWPSTRNLGPCILTPDGNYLFAYRALYRITGSSATNVVSFSNDIRSGWLRYPDAGHVAIAAPNFSNVYSIVIGNGGIGYSINAYSVGGNYFITNTQLLQIDLDTGSTLKSWNLPATYDKMDLHSFNVIGNILYNVNYQDNPNHTCWEIQDTALVESTPFNISNDSSILPLGFTSDNQYLISTSNRVSQGGAVYLRIWKFENNTFTRVEVVDWPTDLQAYANNAYYISFNPYSGYLLLNNAPGTVGYAIFKYENGQFVKKPIDYVPQTTRAGIYSLSMDAAGNRMVWTDYQADAAVYHVPHIVDLTTSNNNCAVKYVSTCITTDSFTGYAVTSCEPEGSFYVSCGTPGQIN